MPRSSATCVADDVKEGGLGLRFSEPESADTALLIRLQTTPPWFLRSVEL